MRQPLGEAAVSSVCANNNDSNYPKFNSHLILFTIDKYENITLLFVKL